VPKDCVLNLKTEIPDQLAKLRGKSYFKRSKTFGKTERTRKEDKRTKQGLENDKFDDLD
jgi:hypothetical protein